MNTSRSLRSKRKKAIPLYFQKSHASLQEILQTASYKRRIKELLKTNKQLAVTLQDAKYKTANQQSKIEEYARTTTQVAHARMKLREMVTNLQKLVLDVDEVATLLDVRSFNILKNAESSDVRMRIALPETSTIEESASSSILEDDITAANESTEGSTETDGHTCTPVKKNESSRRISGNLRTSLAKLDSKLKDCLNKPQEIKNDENCAEVCNASISVESPSTPQLEIIRPKKTGKLEAFLQNYKESPRKPLQLLNKMPLGKSTTNAFVSKIPKVLAMQHIETQDENIPLTPQLTNKASSRRDTFVVQKQCSVPNVLPSATDRRGTFTINILDNKVHNDRRETYLVPPEPVLPISELPVPALNLNMPESSSANEFPNKTILLCEDMELTEIIPTQKIWSEETVEGMTTIKNKEPVTLPAFVPEDTEVVPILKPSPPVMQDRVVEKANSSLEKNTVSNKNLPDIPAFEKPLDDVCFSKPLKRKSKTPPLHSAFKSTTSLEQLPCSGLEDKANSEDSKVLSSRMSKKSVEIDGTASSARETKSRSSSMSKRRSVTRKQSARFSNVKSKGSLHKNEAMASSTEPLLTKPSALNFLSDTNDSLLSDVTLSPSPSSNKRSSRNRKSIHYDKYFEDASKEPIEDKFVPGRKVLNFFETRKSLVPNKRVFVFTNSTKKATSESDVPISKTGPTSSDTENDDIFEFSASEPESPSVTKKHKKERKQTKRSHSAAHGKGKKESASKKSRSEKPLQCLSEKHNKEPCNEKTDLSPKKLSITLESNKQELKSAETSADSFVIGTNIEESSEVKQLVNLKGDKIFSIFSNEVRKTPSRQCKKTSLAEINRKESLFLKKDSLNDVSVPSSLDKKEAVAGLDYDSNEVRVSSSSRSSKLSGEKGKVKRPFSGISERRSKKKSTLDSPDLFEEFQKDILSLKDLPKTADLNDEVSSLDLGMTKVYNFKEKVDTKVQNINLDNPKQVSEVKKKVQEDENLKKTVEPAQTIKTKNMPFDDETRCPSFNEVTEVYNLKEFVDTKVQKRNLVNLKQVSEKEPVQQNDKLKKKLEPPQTIKAKNTLPGGETLPLSLSEVTEVYKLKDVIVPKSQKSNLDSAKQVSEEKRKAQHDENLKKNTEPSRTTKATLPGEETVQQPLDEMTVVYNLKDLIGAKVQKRNLDSQMVVSGTKKIRQDDILLKKIDPPQIEKDFLPDKETLLPSLTEKKKAVKDSKREVEVRQNECKDDLTRAVFPSTENTVSPLSSHKKTLKSCNQEAVVKKIKHAETTVKKITQDIIPIDVVCCSETIAPVLSNKTNYLISKDNKKENKHIEKLHKKLVSTQSINNKTPLDAEAIVLSSTNIKNNASVFNKAELKKFQLDDLSNNDFIPSKSTKDAHKKKATQAKIDNNQAKKSRQNISDSEELQIKLIVPSSVEADQLSRQSKTAYNTDALAVPLEAATARRRNGSGSIDSLYSVESKDQAGSRPSRSTRTTKSFKEPKLNCKMRR